MGFISWVIIGLVAGWVAHRVLGGRSYILNNLALGLVGAIVGGLLYTRLSPETQPGFFVSLVSATVGAIIFLLVWRAIRRG